MLKQWMVIVSLLLSLTGCSNLSFLHERPNQPIIPAKIETRFYTPDDFTQVDVDGNINLNIHTGARRAWFSIHGDTRDLGEIDWKVKNKTKTLKVYLDGRYPKHGPITMDVGLKQFTGLQYDGDGNVTGRRLRAKQLNIQIKNSKNTLTTLEGRMNLQQVVLRGQGRVLLRDTASRRLHVTMFGRVKALILGTAALKTVDMNMHSFLNVKRVRTKILRVKMGEHSFARLAGTVSWMTADLNGNARFNGRKLRATEAFVKTHDSAVARIYVLEKQHTLATDQSNIYYYNTPTYKTDFMGKNGAVLNLGPESNGKKGK